MMRLLCSFLIAGYFAVESTTSPSLKPSIIPSRSPSISPSVTPSANPTSFLTKYYTINTVAGNGLNSFSSGTGGPATSAGFYNPMDVWEDSTGVLYVVDFSSSCVRKFSPRGDTIVSKFLGVCDSSGDTYTGAATSALLHNPFGVQGDSQGSIYVSDENSNRIKKVTSSGIVSLFAGSGATTGAISSSVKATSGAVVAPQGVFVNTVGVFYCVSSTNSQVLMVSTSNIMTVFAGVYNANTFAGNGGPATSASFYSPRAVLGDTTGIMYVVDTTNHYVRKISTSSIVSTVIGTGVSSYVNNNAATSTSMTPVDIEVDATNGNLYISCAQISFRILVIESASQEVTSMVGTGKASFSGDGGAATAATISSNNGIFRDTLGNLYIADMSNSRVRAVYSIEPTVAPTLVPTVLPTVIPSASPTINPTVAPSSSPTAARPTSNSIFLFAGTGTASSTGTGGKATAAAFDNPRGLYQDSLGVMYVSEGVNSCARKFSVSDTIVQAYAGVCGTSGSSGDGGAATSAKLNFAIGLILNSAGVFYIVEHAGSKVRSVSVAGIITTYAGTGSSGLTGDNGAATAATLKGPNGVWVRTDGTLYIAEYLSNVIRSVSASGIIKRVAGTGSTGSSGDNGPATSATFNFIERVLVDSVGVVYIANGGNNNIRTVSTSGILTLFAGSGGSTFNGNGQAATSTAIYYPTSMFIDPSNGDFFVCARADHRILMRTGSTGLMTTYSGTGTSSATGDGGAATSATLIAPDVLFLDTDGKLYLADSDSNQVRVIFSVSPTVAPSPIPTVSPSMVPSICPTFIPTTSMPSLSPSDAPSAIPSLAPSHTPTIAPTTVLLHSPTYKVSNAYAFAGLTSDGSVLCWGASNSGGDCSSVQSELVGVSEIVAGKYAFVALLSGGGLVTWGNADSISGWDEYAGIAISAMVSTERAFAGVTDYGAVIAFGASCCGGNVDQYGWSQYLQSGVVSVYASSAAFAALKSDGSVYTWGSKFAGGGVSSVTRSDVSDVVMLCATRSSFAGVTSGGDVVAWGNSMTGGVVPSSAAAALSGKAQWVLGGSMSFLGLTSEGSSMWGLYETVSTHEVDWLSVTHTVSSFAAVCSNGSVHAMGSSTTGGDASNVAALLLNVSSITATLGSFAALTGDGSVVSWGDADFGATDVVHVNVKSVYHTTKAFAALHVNGSVSVWGGVSHGGSAGSVVAGYLTQDVRLVCGNDVSFTAIHSNGSAVSWGYRGSVSTGVLSGNYSSIVAC